MVEYVELYRIGVLRYMTQIEEMKNQKEEIKSCCYCYNRETCDCLKNCFSQRGKSEMRLMHPSRLLRSMMSSL